MQTYTSEPHTAYAKPMQKDHAPTYTREPHPAYTGTNTPAYNPKETPAYSSANRNIREHTTS